MKTPTDIDMVQAAYRILGAAQGTPLARAFNAGARWMQEQNAPAPEPVTCLRCGFVTHVRDGETPAETTHKAYMQRTAHLRLGGSSEGGTRE